MVGTSFLCLYHGETINASRPLAITAEPDIVANFARRMLDLPPEFEDDPVMEAVEDGRRQAPRVIASE
jgi:hypothetical protein